LASSHGPARQPYLALTFAVPCRTRRARLALSSSPAAIAEPLEWTNHAIMPGATVLEGIAGKWHSSCFGLWGRARCTTCRIFITKGWTSFPSHRDWKPERSPVSGRRRECGLPVRYAQPPILSHAATGRRCQPCRWRDPWWARGSERSITVLFVDLRDPPHWAKPRCLRLIVHSQSVLP